MAADTQPRSARRPAILGMQGRAALDTLVRGGRPLLAFDFDGTLAPLVDRPDDARPPPLVVRRLAALARVVPVAVVSGRSRADLLRRLGFVPSFAVGNHGAEDGSSPAHDDGALDDMRQRLARAADRLARSGVWVEDKGLSLALHHRLAPDAAAAQRLVDDLLHGASPALRVFGGKAVHNLMPRGLPDKADAVCALAQRCGAATALYAGDDVNDQPVFARAPPPWVTVQVGPAPPGCAARFQLNDQGRMAGLLGELLGRLTAPD